MVFFKVSGILNKLLVMCDSARSDAPKSGINAAGVSDRFRFS